MFAVETSKNMLTRMPAASPSPPPPPKVIVALTQYLQVSDPMQQYCPIIIKLKSLIGMQSWHKEPNRRKRKICFLNVA